MGRKKSPQGNKKLPKPYVCLVEGEKTERLYLENTLKLDLQRYDIEKSRCTHALGIVEHAIKQKKKYQARILKIYIVFDREFSTEQTEGTFLDSFSQIDAKLKTHREKIIPIFTSPSIEYVLLLHFTESSRSYSNNSELKSHLKEWVRKSGLSLEYEKNSESFFSTLTSEQVRRACERLKKRDNAFGFDATTSLRKRAEQEKMPNSNFYLLMEASGVVS
jgi:hypothetical protein